MPKHQVVALTKSEPQPNLPQKSAASMSSLPPEIHILIAESLVPIDQLHLGLTCKSLFFLAAPNLLGEAIMRQHRRYPEWGSAVGIAFRAGLVNLDLYDYLLEGITVRTSEFEVVGRVAGRRGDIEKAELWSSRCNAPLYVGAGMGAAESGNIAFLEWTLDRTQAPSDWEASIIFYTAAKYVREDVLDYLHSRLDLTPKILSQTIKIVAEAGHIDLALKLYRQLPLCCNSDVLVAAAYQIARNSIETETESWQAVVAEFLATPSVISDAVGSSMFGLAVKNNRADVMRYVDVKCDLGTCDWLSLALTNAIGNGNTDAFDYICQKRPNWTTLVDDAINDFYFPFTVKSDARIALIRRVVPHVKKRSTLITLMSRAIYDSVEVFNLAAGEFRRRFGSPSQEELEELYSCAYELDEIEALAEHFPPRSTEHANEIAERCRDPFETMEFLRQFCPDVDADIDFWSDHSSLSL